MENVINLHEPPLMMYVVERGIVAGFNRVYTSGSCLGEDCLTMPIDAPRPYGGDLTSTYQHTAGSC